MKWLLLKISKYKQMHLQEFYLYNNDKREYYHKKQIKKELETMICSDRCKDKKRNGRIRINEFEIRRPGK